MGYKEELLKQIDLLREYAKLRQTNPDEAVKIPNQIQVREACIHVSKFLGRLRYNGSDGAFKDKESYDAFITNHHDLIKGDRIPKFNMRNYGVLEVPDVDFKAIFDALENDAGLSAEDLGKIYEESNPNIRANVHPLAETIESLKAEADALFEEKVAKELKASLDYANEEIVAKTGVDVVDNAIETNSDLPGIKAVQGFQDYVKSIGLDEKVVVNKGGQASISGRLFLEENLKTYQPFLEKQVTLDENHTNKILALDKLLKEEGLLEQAVGGESGTKEYGLADYFAKNYALKQAIVAHTHLTSEEEKRASLIKIDQLAKEQKDVCARYDKVFDFIEKNFDLENMNLSGNIYSGRPAEVKGGNLEKWRPNLPPKYDFENSPKVIFLSGFCQLKAACQAGDVSLEDYIAQPTKAYQDGLKKIGQIGDKRCYLPRGEENTLGKRLARALVIDDGAYGHVDGYNVIGGRGMEFLAQTDPKKENQIGNTIISTINKEYNILYSHNPNVYFGNPDEPQLDNIKNLFAFAHREDNLYKVSSHYYDTNAVKSEIYKQYPKAVKERGNVDVGQEYRRIMDAMKDFAAERRYMYANLDKFSLPSKLGEPSGLSSHSLGTLLFAGREYFLDYLKENNLSIASIQDDKLREEVTSFLTDPVGVLGKHVKLEDVGPESMNMIKSNYRSVCSSAKAPNAAEFFHKFNELNQKPDGRNAGKSFTRTLSDNKGSWWERFRNKTSKEYTALQKVGRAFSDPNSPAFGDEKALYVCAKAYKQYKMPEGTNFDNLSSTAKKRVEFCDTIIETYEARQREIAAANQEVPALENNVNDNAIVQDDFQNQLGNDLNPQQEVNNVPVENGNQANENELPDEGVEP